jgi:hypothetical protein
LANLDDISRINVDRVANGSLRQIKYLLGEAYLSAR